jgi:hypothetical protein
MRLRNHLSIVCITITVHVLQAVIFRKRNAVPALVTIGCAMTATE